MEHDGVVTGRRRQAARDMLEAVAALERAWAWLDPARVGYETFNELRRETFGVKAFTGSASPAILGLRRIAAVLAPDVLVRVQDREDKDSGFDPVKTFHNAPRTTEPRPAGFGADPDRSVREPGWAAGADPGGAHDDGVMTTYLALRAARVTVPDLPEIPVAVVAAWGEDERREALRWGRAVRIADRAGEPAPERPAFLPS